MTSSPEVAIQRAKPTSVRPVVAIVGRPNVGKSTLFNRLVGRREAIVQEEPGTTRDRIYADIEWDSVAMTVVDTGGLDLQPQTDLYQQVQQQARIAIAEADAILFLVDAKAGITSADREVAALLRRAAKPMAVVANKADTQAREMAVPEFYELGLGDPIAISAYHGVGIVDLMEGVLRILPATLAMPETAQGIKVAIVGRPNVGKSLLVNAILGEDRALVSPLPGTTRDAIDTPFTYQDTSMTLIDTAGIRRTGRVGQGIERYSVLRAVRAIGRADVAVLVLDATEGLTAQDTHIAGCVRDAYKGLVVAVNKWDLASAQGLLREEVLATVEARFKFFPEVSVMVMSAKTGQGIDRILAAIVKGQTARERRVPTGVVNQCIRQAVHGHPPPPIRGRRLKVLYVTQASAAPPTFVFFVNDPRLVHFSYRRFLENRLREAFGFEGASLRLIFKSRAGE